MIAMKIKAITRLTVWSNGRTEQPIKSNQESNELKLKQEERIIKRSNIERVNRQNRDYIRYKAHTRNHRRKRKEETVQYSTVQYIPHWDKRFVGMALYLYPFKKNVNWSLCGETHISLQSVGIKHSVVCCAVIIINVLFHSLFE